jgi:hypothetical protein
MAVRATTKLIARELKRTQESVLVVRAECATRFITLDLRQRLLKKEPVPATFQVRDLSAFAECALTVRQMIPVSAR